MGVYLRRADFLMSEKHLDGAEVGTALEQCRGEAVTQRVGGDVLPYARLQGEVLDDMHYHVAREVCAAAVEEDIVLFAGLYAHLVALTEPEHEFVDGAA